MIPWLLAAAAGQDTLGTVAQDPDEVREDACRIVEANTRVCTQTTVKPPSPSDSPPDLSFLGLLTWLLIIVAAMFLLYLLVRWLGARLPSRRRVTDDDEVDSVDDEIETGVVQVDRRREPVDWRKEAEAHRMAGRYRDALRCRYRALVGDLARRGLIDEIPGRTTGEERRQWREVRPTAGPAFERAADLFDDAWYGHADVEADDDDRFQALEREVLTAAGDRR